MANTVVKEAKAHARQIRISASKVRIVIDLVRGKPVDEALNILRFLPKRASRVVEKVVRSAAANASHNFQMDEDRLYISEAFVNEGATMKRFQPHMRGQAFPIRKRSSHITVVVKERGAK